MNHKDLRQSALNKPGVKKVYESLKSEYSLLSRMLTAREKANLTQAEVARRMGTKAPAIVRLERSLETGTHSPSLNTLIKYAEAVNCTLDIRLVASR